MGDEHRPKIFVPDTNALIINEWAPWILAGADIPDSKAHQMFLKDMAAKGKAWNNNPNTVVLCDVVLRELDHISHKDRPEDEYACYKSRVAGRRLEDLFATPIIDRQGFVGCYGSGLAHVSMDNGADVLWMEHNEKQFLDYNIPNAVNDDRLIMALVDVQRSNPNHQVTFVSADVKARTKAALHGIVAEDFEIENVKDPNQMYQGITKILTPNSEYGLRIKSKQGFTVSRDDMVELIGKEPQHNEVAAFYACPEAVMPDAYFIVKRGSHGFFMKPVAGDELQTLIAKHNTNSTELKPFLERVLRRELNEEGIRQYLYNLINKSQFTVQSGKSHDRRNQPRRDNPSDGIGTYRRRIAHLDVRDFQQVKKLYNQLQALPGARDKYCEEDTDLLARHRMNEEINPMLEQQPYACHLLDKDIGVLSCSGPAGSGKTLLALLAGLLQVEEGKYSSVRYIKPLVESDKGVGFLKGTFREKIMPFNQSAISNLKELFGYYDKGREYKTRIDATLEEMEGEVIEYMPMTFEAGNTWRNQKVIIDEAQLITRDQLRLMMGRAGRGTQLVFIGDLAQIATSRGRAYSYLTERNSGYAHLIDRLTGERLYAHIAISKEAVKRSEIAKLVEKL